MGYRNAGEELTPDLTYHEQAGPQLRWISGCASEYRKLIALCEESL